MIRHLYAGSLFAAMIVCSILKASSPTHVVIDIGPDDDGPILSGMSSNGNLVWMHYDAPSLSYLAFRWRTANGMLEDLGNDSLTLASVGGIDNTGNVAGRFQSYTVEGTTYYVKGNLPASWTYNNTSETELSFDEYGNPDDDVLLQNFFYADAGDVDSVTGDIYGQAQTYAASAENPGDPDQQYVVNDGVEWSGGGRSELGSATITYSDDGFGDLTPQWDGTQKLVFLAKNGHTFGLETDLETFNSLNDVEGSPVSYLPEYINSHGDTIGQDGADVNIYYAAGGQDTMPPNDEILDINYTTLPYTSGGTTTNVPAPQILILDTNSAPAIVQKDPNTGSFTNTEIVPYDTTYTSISPSQITDDGLIDATATKSGHTRVIELLPCQFQLLNGSTNSADVDGMDFNGNRPTTISATTNYNTATAVANDIGATYDGGAGNYAIDVIGVDLPLGEGRANVTTPVYIPEAHQCYIDSLMMLAKVSASTNITYGWNRVYQAGDVSIAQTSTNTWYVTKIGLPTGVPSSQSDLDSGVYGYETTTPITNNYVITCWDNPGMYVPNYTNAAPSIGDLAYHKFAFTYSVTNSIGAASAIATQQVGQRMVIRRIAVNNVIATDWTNVVNTVSTTNIPSPYFTTNEIRDLVSPSTNQIIFDPNVLVTP